MQHEHIRIASAGAGALTMRSSAWQGSPCARLRRCGERSAICLATSQRTQPQLPLPGVLIARELRDNSGVTTTYMTTAKGPALLQQAEGLPARQQTGAWAALRALYLPSGFPHSVTPDYLAFQLWSVPAHITGYISVGLTTSSLLQAVGISAGPLGTTAAAAAIKWIAKDGLGALGRLVVGSRLGREFDTDPQRWRLIAEAVNTAGLTLEIMTTVFPAYFLPLASAGNFTKALARGIVGPVFRVIQTHFATSSNVGAVAAKEEVWDVSGQLLGYAASLLLLKSLENTASWHSVVGVWAAVQAVHVWFRYMSLRQLAFPTLNQKRACLLAMSHVAGQPLPSVAEGNRLEPIMAAPSHVGLRVWFGVSLEAAVDGPASTQRLECSELVEVLALYAHEWYVLGWHDGAAYVALRQGFAPTTLLRAMWQAAWLQQQWRGTAATGSSQASQGMQQLHDSLQALSSNFDAFIEEAEAAGWHTQEVVMTTGPITFVTDT